VGFSGINNKIHNLTGVNMEWYDLTDYFGYLAIGVAALFALVGLIQLVKRKSLFKVDREIICLGVLFVAVIGFYVGFEHFIINYRPVIMPDAAAPEASYPSSHTMLIITVMGASMMLIRRYLGSGFLSGLLRLICFLIIVATVAGRLYSGVHWFTDIVGGCLLSISLIELYGATVREYEPPQKSGAKVEPVDGYTPKH
jgi:undecaprenyl-diphosphatase